MHSEKLKLTLGIPFTAVCPRSAREPAHINACGPLPYQI